MVKPVYRVCQYYCNRICLDITLDWLIISMDAMDLQHCIFFKDIAHSRSVSRGAQMSGVSQSAASQYLHELEQHLGVVLLDRSTRPLVVTPAGKLYLELCRDGLRRKEEFEATLDRLKNEVEGTVRVASIYSVGLSEMVRLEQEFARR